MRAWDFKKPILVAPAMNTFMWDHPVTSQHLSTLKTWGYSVIDPCSKTLSEFQHWKTKLIIMHFLVCGETGMGAMASVTTIIQTIEEVLKT